MERIFKDIEHDVHLTESELREEWDNKTEEERAENGNRFEIWLSNCMTSEGGTLEEVLYMNRQHGYLLTRSEAIDEYIEEYDGGDPTNNVPFREYYEKIRV